MTLTITKPTQVVGNPHRTDEKHLIAVLGNDPVLRLDIRLMLIEAGFEVQEVERLDSLPPDRSRWATAIVDIGRASVTAVEALCRLSKDMIPYVVISDEAFPGAERGNPLLRGQLTKPLCVDGLLKIL